MFIASDAGAEQCPDGTQPALRAQCAEAALAAGLDLDLGRLPDPEYQPGLSEVQWASAPPGCFIPGFAPTATAADWKIAPSYNTNMSAQSPFDARYHRICRAETPPCDPGCYLNHNVQLREEVSSQFTKKYLIADPANLEAAARQGHKYALRHYVKNRHTPQAKRCTCTLSQLSSATLRPS